MGKQVCGQQAKIQAKRTWTLIIKGREFFLFWALIHVNVLGQPNRGKLKTHSIKNANGRTVKDDSMRGQIETGLTVKEKCKICAGIDEIGLATKLMTRTSPKNISNNDEGLVACNR